MADTITIAHVGIIGSSSDSAGKGRVKVRLPWLPSDEGVWARVCRPFGMPATTPQVGTTVLVLFEGGNPKTRVVLGRLD